MLPRRHLLAGLLAAPLAPGAPGAHAQTTAPGERFPDRVTLVIAGPPGGGLDLLARPIARGLQANLPPGTTVGRTPIGGVDGVTGANQFGVQTGLDGSAVLLVPGAASLAWLTGDSRVHFDPSRWLPVLARTEPAFVLGRDDLQIRGRRMRVAAAAPTGPALAAMLALDLLGAHIIPVYGLGDDTAALVALQAGRVDAMLLRRTGFPDAATSAYPAVRPLFALGEPFADGRYRRDPRAADVPTLVEYAAALGRPPLAGPAFAAWCCAADAVQLRYALVLPSLTPPAAVALWRQAGAHAVAPSAAGNIVYASAASELMRPLRPDGAAVLYLRGWLTSRLGWQPKE